jgi:hypothetical protein
MASYKTMTLRRQEQRGDIKEATENKRLGVTVKKRGVGETERKSSSSL